MEPLGLQARLYHYWALKIASDTHDIEKLSEMETFKDRIDWAEDHWEHLSSGSSRIIYKLPNDKVLKLAKNKRGLAQNIAESNPQMKCKYINSTEKYDKDGVWKISPWADKITEKEFEKLTGLNFKEFGDAIGYGLRSVNGDSSEKKSEGFEEVAKTDLYKELVKVGKKFHLMPGDMVRISSWGKVEDAVVLLDAGLTSDIFDEFYEDKTCSSTNT